MSPARDFGLRIRTRFLLAELCAVWVLFFYLLIYSFFHPSIHTSVYTIGLRGPKNFTTHIPRASTGHRLPSSSRPCTSVLVRSAAVRRWSADETSRPAALVDLQSTRRPPVAACHCRRSLICCCWPTTLKQSTCRRPVCPITHNILSETENTFISPIIPRHCSVAASPWWSLKLLYT